ncbi:MAG: hypothetical protein BWY63_03730 [Chloroflexi bacterium ADurb.Bin360]|nr:MAG: hypothetical protein BWY63_03730 [Chloroflexi bacterium ADurb.Bin360]
MLPLEAASSGTPAGAVMTRWANADGGVACGAICGAGCDVTCGVDEADGKESGRDGGAVWTAVIRGVGAGVTGTGAPAVAGFSTRTLVRGCRRTGGAGEVGADLGLPKTPRNSRNTRPRIASPPAGAAAAPGLPATSASSNLVPHWLQNQRSPGAGELASTFFAPHFGHTFI